jgi:hypothetical protein
MFTAGRHGRARGHEDRVAVALLSDLTHVGYTCWTALQTQGLWSLPVHESIADAQDEAVALTCDPSDAGAKTDTGPAMRIPQIRPCRTGTSALHCSAVPRFAAQQESPIRFSSLHIVSPTNSVIVSASHLPLQILPSVLSSSPDTHTQKPAIHHPTWRHHVCPPLHVRRRSADRPQSKSAQSSPTC